MIIIIIAATGLFIIAVVGMALLRAASISSREEESHDPRTK